MLAMALFFAACAGDDGNPGDPAEKPGQIRESGDQHADLLGTHPGG